MLDGEGGRTVWGKIWPAEKSVAYGALPIGLAHNVTLKRPVKRDQVVTLADVEITDDLDIHALRAEQRAMMES